MRHCYVLLAALCAALPFSTACSSNATVGDNAGTAAHRNEHCFPDRTVYEAKAAPLLQRKCGKCHGAPPNFGAPISLTEYAAIVTGTPGRRLVDGITSKVQAFQMPPPGNPQLTQEELESLLDWSSCGEIQADSSRGVQASRPVWHAPAEPAAQLRRVDLLAAEYAVPSTGEQTAQFSFQNLVDHDMFIRRLDATIDESRVIHHVTLQYTSDSTYLYAWAPGTGAVEFPDGGLRIRPADSFDVGVHYNNGTGLANLRDSSGISIFVNEPSGTEYGLMSPVTFAIDVPPQSVATATAVCTATLDFRIIAAMPHMHRIGQSIRHDVERTSGTVDEIISLDGWSFDLQSFYDTQLDVKKGDVLRLRCAYRNPYNHAVRGGARTEDEMCYDFLYVTPPGARSGCQGLL